jgi:hypothetical protein
MSLYNIIRNLSVAVLLTTSISFAMQDDGKNSDDVNKARLTDMPSFVGVPLLTLSNFSGLSSNEAEAFRAFASSSVASDDPVVSTRLASEETSEQTTARTTVPVSFIDDLLKATNGYVEREDLDESESTADQAKHIVISLVNRINTLYENNARERESASADVTYTQEQVNAMFAAYASLGVTRSSADNV